MNRLRICEQLLNGNYLNEQELKEAKSVLNSLENEYLKRIGLHKGNFTKVNNDVNGNPRYVCHYCAIGLNVPKRVRIIEQYNYVVKFCNKLGGKKYHNKSYGGGIVWQSYNLDSTIRAIKEAVKEHNKKVKQ